MFDVIRNVLLRLMRVPPEPEPPQGSPESVRVFRAGRNFYMWSVVRWGAVQALIVVATTIILTIITLMSRGPNMPYLFLYLLGALGWLILLIFVAQFFVSFFLLRLNYEMRWYIVTDRSLRIRYGVWSLEEMTMTFANIQQINTIQGPLQRVLGIANLEVTSAGGGQGSSHKAIGKHSHSGYFEGVDNAQEIRDVIQERLKRYRDSGLGDPDDHHAHVGGEDASSAAEELLREARELRRVVSSVGI